MKPRKIIEEKLTFSIKPSKDYKERPFCTWGQLISTEGPLPEDTLDELHWKEERIESPPFGSMDEYDNYPKTYYTPSVTVIRPRPENDKEYEERMRGEENIEKDKNEREKLEYLRLKAKFENNETN